MASYQSLHTDEAIREASKLVKLGYTFGYAAPRWLGREFKSRPRPRFAPPATSPAGCRILGHALCFSSWHTKKWGSAKQSMGFVRARTPQDAGPFFRRNFSMAGFFLFSCRAAGMGNFIDSGGRRAGFALEEKPEEENPAFLAFLRVLRSKTGKNQPGAAPVHLKLAKCGFWGFSH